MKKKIVFLLIMLLACTICILSSAEEEIEVTVSEPTGGKVYLTVEKDAGWEYSVSVTLTDTGWEYPAYDADSGKYVMPVGEDNGGDLETISILRRKLNQKDSAGNSTSEWLECSFDGQGILKMSERTVETSLADGGSESLYTLHQTKNGYSSDTLEETKSVLDKDGKGTTTEKTWRDGNLVSDYLKNSQDSWNYTVSQTSYDQDGRITYLEETETKDGITSGTTSSWSFYDDGTLEKEKTVTKGEDGETSYEKKSEYDKKGILTSEYEFTDQGETKEYTWISTSSQQPAKKTEVVYPDGSELYTEYDASGNETLRYRYKYDQVQIGNEYTDRKTEIRYDAEGKTLGKRETCDTRDENGGWVTVTSYFDANGNKTGSTKTKSGETDYSAFGISIKPDQTEITPGGTISAAYTINAGSGIYNSISYNICGIKDDSYRIVNDSAFTLTETAGTLSFSTQSLSGRYFSGVDESWMYYFTDYCFEITAEDAVWGAFTVVSPSVAVHRTYVGATGWICIDGKWYYGDSEGIACVGMLELGDYGLEKYYLDENGVLQTGWFQDSTGAWFYADASGKIEEYFREYDSLYVPAEVTNLDNISLFGVKRTFILQCTPGSAAEKYAKEHGIAYDNGSVTVSGSSIASLNEKVKWVVDTYTAPDMSDLEKAERLHDWVIYNTIYNDAAAEALTAGSTRGYESCFDPAGPLLYGTGVCDGYAKAYQMLLNQAGIENQYITGPVGSWKYGYEGEGEGHAWNLVKIDGSWYHVDCTFDDQGVGYEYFLASDEFMRGDHKWTSGITCGGDYAFSEGYYQGMGWKQLSDGSWIYRGSSWAHHYEVFTGAHEIDGVMYFFDARGHLVSNGWFASGGYWYYIDASGSPVAGEWRFLGNAWYYFLSDGRMANGWQEIGGVWYYFEGGAMATGWRNLNGTWYYFTPEGAMADGWQNLGGTWYYFDGGAMATGWRQFGGVWYYFADGAMATGWQNLGGVWYYFADGAMTIGWQLIDGRWEMFDVSGAWLYTWQGN